MNIPYSSMVLYAVLGDDNIEVDIIIYSSNKKRNIIKKCYYQKRFRVHPNRSDYKYFS